MKSVKIVIVLTFLFTFVFSVVAQKTKTSKKLETLDLIVMNNKAKNLEPGFMTPNELEGYEFFRKGKLNKLRLGVSTKVEVKKIFGSDCEDLCKYDSELTIQIDYFDETLVIVDRTFDKDRNEYNEKQIAPKRESIGKILSIALQPNKRVSFNKLPFSREFKKSSYLETGYGLPDTNDVLGIAFDYYGDSYGLQYLIFDKILNESLEDTFNLKAKFVDYQKGDLISIKYMIPEELENRFFDETK
jgi:hypothetical protein